MQTALYFNNKRFTEKEFSKEKELEDLMFQNSKSLFGQNSIIIEAKKKIENKTLGGTIPDAFLFDLNDPENPEFYLVEVELASHSFYNHIFPQITKFFAFYKNPVSQSELIEKLYSLVNADPGLKKQFKDLIGNKEIFKFIKDTLENSQNILLVLDNEKPELPEIINTYTDTWGKIVKLTLLKEYCNNGASIISLTPEFANLTIIELVSGGKDEASVIGPYTEDYHLEDALPEIKEAYRMLHDELTKRIKELKFNPQRYYISLRKKKNFAYVKIQKKKMTIVAMLDQESIKDRIKQHKIVSLAEGVQKFYNGPCAQIIVAENNNLEEIVNLLVEIQK